MLLVLLALVTSNVVVMTDAGSKDDEKWNEVIMMEKASKIQTFFLNYVCHDSLPCLNIANEAHSYR